MSNRRFARHIYKLLLRQVLFKPVSPCGLSQQSQCIYVLRLLFSVFDFYVIFSYVEFGILEMQVEIPAVNFLINCSKFT